MKRIIPVVALTGAALIMASCGDAQTAETTVVETMAETSIETSETTEETASEASETETSETQFERILPSRTEGEDEFSTCSFVVENHSGSAIDSVTIAVAGTGEYTENLLSEPIAAGEAVEIMLDIDDGPYDVIIDYASGAESVAVMRQNEHLFYIESLAVEDATCRVFYQEGGEEAIETWVSPTPVPAAPAADPDEGCLGDDFILN